MALIVFFAHLFLKGMLCNGCKMHYIFQNGCCLVFFCYQFLVKLMYICRAMNSLLDWRFGLEALCLIGMFLYVTVYLGKCSREGYRSFDDDGD